MYGDIQRIDAGGFSDPADHHRFFQGTAAVDLFIITETEKDREGIADFTADIFEDLLREFHPAEEITAEFIRTLIGMRRHKLCYQIPVRAMDLNAIRSGISRAVEERLRSERMKTELITNVSHDIKTPLTSIVSYVDLLSREEIDNEQAKKYIEVLRRQSARLKKLTDDLVEASKASSGVLAFTIEDCDLSVMLDQTAGEYGEKLAEKNLELVLRKPEKEVRARADARHTQRIFDNLMSNILKYALPGTRVYLELKEDENGPAVIFRNTSRSEIVQSPEELTERFVRGDASRSSEGSGLGLSIARSLAELQGGSLAVTVDGDLFKVTLGFAEK